MNEYRASVVDKVFDSIDTEHCGQIHYSELCKNLLYHSQNIQCFRVSRIQTPTKIQIKNRKVDV